MPSYTNETAIETRVIDKEDGSSDAESELKEIQKDYSLKKNSES